MNKADFPGLGIANSLVSPECRNFCPPVWPPNFDWPVVVNGNGDTVSTWGDSVWILDVWAKKRCVLSFWDGEIQRGRRIDKPNADLLRVLTGWWLYGACRVRTAETLHIRFSTIRPIFALCTELGIVASDLWKNQDRLEQVAKVINSAMSEMVIFLLHELNTFADAVGFKLLDKRGISRLAALMPPHEKKQTPYIPPRIWHYQVRRLRECLDDFLNHRKELEMLFQFCLDAYIQNFETLSGAIMPNKNAHWVPFGGKGNNFGTFYEAADKFGVAQVLSKWVASSAKPSQSLSVDMLSSYLTLINYVSIGYILNFSLMRIDEAVSLRTGCQKSIDDPRFGRIYLIEGCASIDGQEELVHWITSESSCLAIEALDVVSGLRRRCKLEQLHDRLMQSVCEPWGCGCRQLDERNISTPLSYGGLLQRFPLLMDPEELRITPRDLALARLATPSLGEEFVVGAVWLLAWHQLRRTGAVNMQASGLVSESSLQFQLKHLSRSMSLYYGQNYSKIHLEETAQSTFVKAMYEVVGRELQMLASNRFVSPYGIRRKDELLRLVSLDDFNQAVSLAMRGGVACREVIFGGCMNAEPCPYGGIESVAHCGGGDSGKPCPQVLYDREKKELVLRLDHVLDERLSATPSGSPLHESLAAQKRSVMNYLSTIE